MMETPIMEMLTEEEYQLILDLKVEQDYHKSYTAYRAYRVNVGEMSPVRQLEFNRAVYIERITPIGVGVEFWVRIRLNDEHPDVKAIIDAMELL
jgi:hypothetical protein